MVRMFRQRVHLPIKQNYYLSLISGWEAGIATTTAIIAGTLTGTDNRQIVIVSSLVALAVQGFNSALNHLEISHHLHEIEDSEHKETLKLPLTESGVQFGAHLIGSLVVLAPISAVANLDEALLWSVGTAIGLLFISGVLVGISVKHQPFRNGITTMILGALVITVGFIAGLAI